jgi:hypothetical protein
MLRSQEQKKNKEEKRERINIKKHWRRLKRKKGI